MIDYTNTFGELVVEVRQGEDRHFAFTIKQNGEPMDLTDWKVRLQVKKAPYYSIPSLLTKEVTTTSNEREDGLIYSPTEGKLKFYFSKEDILRLCPFDYSLVIELINGEQIINISKNRNKRSVFRVLNQ